LQRTNRAHMTSPQVQPVKEALCTNRSNRSKEKDVVFQNYSAC
jgi:hypothetical protein